MLGSFNKLSGVTLTSESSMYSSRVRPSKHSPATSEGGDVAVLSGSLVGLCTDGLGDVVAPPAGRDVGRGKGDGPLSGGDVGLGIGGFGESDAG